MDSLADVSVSPNSLVLFGCTARGKVIRLRIEGGGEDLLFNAGWDYPLAVTYLPETEDDGYLLDRLGTVHHVGRTSIFTRYSGGRYAPSWESGWARDLAFFRDRSALLLLDAFGGVHPLGLEGEAHSENLPYLDVPVFCSLRVWGESVMVMDVTGRTYQGRLIREAR